ncbi:D-methionine transport system ATP-binding protein [Natronobacillus azotifigens]|uniref:ATP-binding cassette domain-containing protein n=1 Tax=Natronobacillus azotifigens TaxID=472978 RepID=A0A9J6RA85_9BACI|nr:ATP-binding cassette domain-containing protein [Natronobacillus azotifigens]MCZ0702169.1 ATP-binding cassette domain-containing protein [Natronobacillus azotifigens]
MIILEDIHKVYLRKNVETTALKGVSLQVDKGDIFGVIGYSGAGKSTLVRLVNYLERPTSGKVIVDGQLLADRSAHELRQIKKDIGMIFQHFNLLESKTIYQNVAMPLILSKKGKKETKERVTELLAFVGLSDKANSYPNELSGGQKQRVGIARALASKPKILLCDEATSALDPQTTQSILDLLKKVNNEYGITIMLITHEMSVIQKVCNKVAVMEEGEIIEQGSVLDVFGHPKHATSKNFVQTVVRTEIPENIKRKLAVREVTTLTKLEMVGDHATEPVLQSLINKFHLDVSVVFTNMTEIQDTTLAIWYLQIEGKESDKRAAWQFLEEQNVRYEEVTV